MNQQIGRRLEKCLFGNFPCRFRFAIVKAEESEKFPLSKQGDQEDGLNALGIEDDLFFFGKIPKASADGAAFREDGFPTAESVAIGETLKERVVDFRRDSLRAPFRNVRHEPLPPGAPLVQEHAGPAGVGGRANSLHHALPRDLAGGFQKQGGDLV